MLNLTEETPVWYALSATYHREMKAKELFDECGVENFVPMRYTETEGRRGRRVRKLVPAVSNLIFAKTTRHVLQEIKAKRPYIQYKTQPKSGKNVPIVVPEYQMEQFMAVCRNLDSDLLYLDSDRVDLQRGTRVKIVGGAFNGVEGVLVKVKGIRGKRVVVALGDLATVATAEISQDLIKVI